jgi:hypothetical protein
LSPLLLCAAVEKESVSINLEAYGGAESILLIWDLPTEDNIASIQLFRSSDLMSSFEIIDLDETIRDRYLDRNVQAGELLFYRIEIQMFDGTVYSSPLKTPALARPLDILEKERIIESNVNEYPETIFSIDEIVNIHSFNSTLLHDFFNKQFPIEIENIQILQMYLLMEEVDFSSFINVFTLEDLKVLKFLFDDFDKEVIENYIDDSFQKLEPIFRQNLLLSPAEWNLEKLNLLRVITAKLNAGEDIYYEDQVFLESLPEMRIAGLIRSEDTLKVQIVQLVETASPVQLKNGDESVEVNLFENPVTTIIPNTWEYVELWLNNMLIQSVPVIYEKGTMTISLDNQFIFDDEDRTVQIIRSIPDHEYELNEIGFKSFNNKLSIEISGQSEGFKELGVFIDDSLLFEWETSPTFTLSYLDSSSNLPENRYFNWLHLCQFENDKWEIIESRPLKLDSSYHEGKVPDMGSWSELSFVTFGEANDITKSTQVTQMIPEIFALYQNYPNPFNSSTKITFDLLEESVVSLFVTDARGRKLDIFLDEVFLENGTYSFNWSGEFRSSGVYFITVEAQSAEYLPVVMSRKMIYLK